MIHFLLVTLGSRDLIELALASIDKYAGECEADIVDLPKDTTDPAAHGRAIDFWRHRQKIGIRDTDLVAIMDPDCALLSEWWRREVDAAFVDSQVGIWGAGNAAAWGPRVHASMMVIRGQLFNNYEYSFIPQSADPRWRDTGGNYCRLASGAWKIIPVEQAHDWHGFSAWGSWTHLGGGSHSDVTRMTWKQRYLVPWRRRAIWKRKRFKRAVREHLKTS